MEIFINNLINSSLYNYSLQIWNFKKNGSYSSWLHFRTRFEAVCQVQYRTQRLVGSLIISFNEDFGINHSKSVNFLVIFSSTKRCHSALEIRQVSAISRNILLYVIFSSNQASIIPIVLNSWSSSYKDKQCHSELQKQVSAISRTNFFVDKKNYLLFYYLYYYFTKR